MKITRIPERYSSAFTNNTAIFKIDATQNEIINVDIYDNANTKIIGCKRYTGATTYEVNVGNYAKQQLEITPIRTNKTQFVYPQKRVVKINIKIGATNSSSELTAGVEKLPLVQKLSKSPDILNITKSQQDEISIRTDDIPISAKVTLNGNSKTDWFSLGLNNATPGITTIGINMKDVQTKLNEIGAGSIEQYQTMKIEVIDETGLLFTQKYRIVDDEPDDVRICWWNHYGQIDYYTMKKIVENQFIVQKNRIYTAAGYKTIASTAQKITKLISKYENIATMDWIIEILAAPKVWIEKNTKIYPVEILSDKITTSTEKLARLEIEITDPTKITFQTN